MEQTTPTASTPQPNEQLPPPPQPQLSIPPSSSSLPPSSSSLSSAASPALPSSLNPNPTPKLSTPQPPQQSQSQSQPQHPPPPLPASQQQPPFSQNSQTRPPFSRPWQQPSHFSHFSSHLSSAPPHSSSSSPSPPPVPPFSSSASLSISVPPAQRGGMAIGVPAHHPSPPSPPTSFSSLNPPPFGQQFGGLGRNAVNVPETVAGSSTSQVRQPIQGIQGMGMMGSLVSGSPMRPGGVPAHHQLRPVQSSLRPQTSPSSQAPASQSFQGHGMLRVSSVGSPSSPSPNSSQSPQPPNQPWLSSGSQGKPPLPPPSLRPQMNPPSLQQRSHIPQQHHQSVPTAPQQQQTSSVQQPSSSHQPQEHYTQQLSSSRAQQPLPHLQQITRGQGLGNQKPSLAMVQPSAVQPGPPNRTAGAETSETCNRILSKRSIQELVTQIDPSERLDLEVEDVLVDIADEFVESITTFGCSLAKHRKSTTLEAKDILLHLERNWNMTLPGFSGDEIKGYKKPFASDIHRERLAVIKKSIVAAETATNKSLTGHAGGNAKGHLAKAPSNVLGSPNSKLREAA